MGVHVRGVHRLCLTRRDAERRRLLRFRAAGAQRRFRDRSLDRARGRGGVRDRGTRRVEQYHCAGVTVKRILAVLGIMSLSSAVAAQTYPTRVIRYVVSDAPGSGLDALARIIAEALSAQWGQQVVIDNRPGAGGNIGAEVIARATPDGYTIGQIATTHAVNATLYKTLGYDLVRDLTGITQLASVPSIAVTPSSSQLRTIADLVKAAKTQPGALTYASAG